MNLLPKPLIKDWMSSAELDFREEVPKDILKLRANEFFDSTTFKIEGFFDNGIGSVVCKISDKNGDYAVKTALNTNSILIESEFYKSWEQNGVSVVRVLKMIKPTDGQPMAYEILEYMEGERTSAKLSKLNIENLVLYFQLGEQLGLMHKSRAQGFGTPQLSHIIEGQFPTFSLEIQHSLNEEQLNYLEKEGVFTANERETVSKCILILTDDIAKGRLPCFNHNDLGLHNTFGLEKVIIFDPVPRITHPYMDLATTILWASLTNSREAAIEEVKKGYMRSSRESISLDVLNAAIYLRTLEKLTKWIKRSKSEEKVVYWVKRGVMLLEESRNNLI
jgi:hypothetical protein